MPRWEPLARERLEEAALDLFEAQGYETTTVADIASRANVTPRTFFRHFADKREVMFGSADEIHACITRALGDVPPDVAPLDACLEAMKACEVLFDRRTHDFLRRRTAVIACAEELQDRESRKLRGIAADVAAALGHRDLDPRGATTVADYATNIVFVHASDLWMHDPGIPFATAIDRANHRARALLDAPEGRGSRGDE